MADDLFRRVGVRDESKKMKQAYLIACLHCSNTDHVHIKNASGTLPFDVVANKFRNRGWEIGHNRRHDTCPECSTRLSAKVRRPGNFQIPPENPNVAKQAACNGLLRELRFIRDAFHEGRELDDLPRRLAAVEQEADRMKRSALAHA